MDREDKKRKGLSASFVTGAVALVFLIVGYQVALFLNRTAISKILADRSSPDTVYIAYTIEGNVQTAKEQAAPWTGSVNDGNRTTGNGTVRNGAERNGTDGNKTSKNGNDGTRSGRQVANKDIRIVSNAPRYRIDQNTGERTRPAKRRPVENFMFNPNTASIEDFQRLGFSEKQASALVNYRNKGGIFRRKSDFAKSFVVADSVYRRLEPYIDIPLLDLNTADSAAFDGLPGIGGYFANKIIEYRTRLRGYSHKEQLMDIYRFDKEKYDALHDLVTVDISTSTPYPLWSLPEDSLAKHPYIGWHAAHGISVYKSANPVEKWTMGGIIEAGILDPGMGDKLARCLIAPPDADIDHSEP
jgi:DNA uptake protein ComE-like DNA-binding protein